MAGVFKSSMIQVHNDDQFIISKTHTKKNKTKQNKLNLDNIINLTKPVWFHEKIMKKKEHNDCLHDWQHQKLNQIDGRQNLMSIETKGGELVKPTSDTKSTRLRKSTNLMQQNQIR